MIKMPPPFEFLGFDGYHYQYKIPASKQALFFNANQHTKNNLLTLAPIEWWDKNGFSYLSGGGLTKAVSWLFEEGKRVK